MIRPLLLAAVLLAPGAALAQTAPLPPASAAPSAASPPSVSGDAGGGGRYGRMNMSPQMQQARQAMMQACAADFAKFCADAPAGGGGRMQCLRQHSADMSDGCRGSMEAMRAARQSGAPGRLAAGLRSGDVLAPILAAALAMASGWNGAWVLSPARNPPAIKAQAAADYRFTVDGAGGLRWEIPSLREDNRGRLDGAPMAIRRPGGTPGMTLAVKAEGPYVWTYLVAKDGRPVGQGRMALAESGRTWVDVSGPYGRPDQAGVVIYVRPGASGPPPR